MQIKETGLFYFFKNKTDPNKFSNTAFEGLVFLGKTK